MFGISRYMSAVAQPDEEPPYPVRTAFQRCLGDSTDTVLVQRVESYVKAHPGSSNGPMTAVVMRALFDFCRAEISKIKTTYARPEVKRDRASPHLREHPVKISHCEAILIGHDFVFDAIFERIKKVGFSYGSAPWSLDDCESQRLERRPRRLLQRSKRTRV